MCHNCEKKSKAVDLNSLNHIQLRSFSESSNAIKMFWLRRTKHRYPTPGELTRPSARNTFTLGSTFYHTVFLSQQVTAGHSRSQQVSSWHLTPSAPSHASEEQLLQPLFRRHSSSCSAQRRQRLDLESHWLRGSADPNLKKNCWRYNGCCLPSFWKTHSGCCMSRSFERAADVAPLH